MRSLPALGIWGTVLALSVAGCMRSSPDRMGISKATPAEQVIHAGDETASVMAGLRLRKAALEALRQSETAGAYLPEPPLGELGTSEGVSRRISDALAQWEEYRAELGSTPYLPGAPGERLSQSGEPAFHGSTTSEGDILAVQRKYSADYLNLRMRIALLESRLAAADTSDQAILKEKLNRTRAELKSVDEACQAEIKKLNHVSSSTNSASSCKSEPQPAAAGDAASSGGSSSSAGALHGLYSPAGPKPGPNGGRPVRAFDEPGYRKILADTCDSLNHAISLLERPQGEPREDR